MSTQKSQVRFYIGQTLSPHKCHAPPIPQPWSRSPTLPQQGQNYPWTENRPLPQSPNPTTTLPPLHLYPPPCWRGKHPRQRTRSKCTLGQNMNITTNIRTIRVKRKVSLNNCLGILTRAIDSKVIRGKVRKKSFNIFFKF